MSTTMDRPQTTESASSAPRSLPVGEWVLVAGCCLVVLVGLAPELVITNSYPLGTDLTGHVVVPWIDRTDPLAWLPGSWSNAMFNGFPVNQLYPWLPSLLAGLLSYLMPLAIAFKLVVVTPLVALPWAAWLAGRWAAVPAPAPLLLAVGTVPFLYDTSCGSCGGNITSTINGEYSFAWSLMFAVLALGAVDRLARERRGVVTAVLLVAATSFSHPLPPLWLLVGVVVIFVGREVWNDRRGLALFGAAALAAALLSAMWWIPFLGRRDWVPQVELIRGEQTLSWIFPASTVWEVAVTALAVLGLGWAVRRRAYLLVAFGAGSVVALVAFVRLTNGGPFYSIRMLPFWEIGRWTLAAVGFGWVLSAVVARVRTDRGKDLDPLVAPLIWLLLAAVVVGTTWGWWGVTTPATVAKEGKGGLFGIETTVTNQSAGVRSTLGGFNARSDYAALTGVQQLLRDVGAKRGCGTLMWDNGDPEVDGGVIFGDAQVFWQSAIWTDGCVVAADGVLVDSSMTAPTMQATKSLVSTTVEALLPDRPSYGYNLADGGAERLQTMGVRYYLTHGGQSAADAGRAALLKPLATSGTWQVWEVDRGVNAASLLALPAVFEPTLSDADWESVSNVYFKAATFNRVPITQSGDDAWPRASLSALPPIEPKDPAGVSKIALTQDSITFEVARTGLPVVVRVSAYPGWTVTGAEGPYRATPNYLVVVPTSTTVTLVKSRTMLDWLAILSAVAGLALLATIVVVGRRTRRTDGDADAHEEGGEQDAADEGGEDGMEADVDEPATDDGREDASGVGTDAAVDVDQPNRPLT